MLTKEERKEVERLARNFAEWSAFYERDRNCNREGHMVSSERALTRYLDKITEA